MAKTNPIGVRFDVDLWEKFNSMGINTAQKILNFLEDWYINNLPKVIEVNNQPENKAKIEEERNSKTTTAQVDKEKHEPKKEEKRQLTAFEIYRNKKMGLK